VLATLASRTNEYANIFHGPIQWLPLPLLTFHRPKLTHQDLSPRTLLPLGSRFLVVVDGRRSGVAGRGSQVVLRFRSIKRSWLSLYLLYYSRSTFGPKGCHSAEMFIYCTYLPQLLPLLHAHSLAPSSRRQHFVASQKLRKY